MVTSAVRAQAQLQVPAVSTAIDLPGPIQGGQCCRAAIPGLPGKLSGPCWAVSVMFHVQLGPIPPGPMIGQRRDWPEATSRRGRRRFASILSRGK